MFWLIIWGSTSYFCVKKQKCNLIIKNNVKTSRTLLIHFCVIFSSTVSLFLRVQLQFITINIYERVLSQSHHTDLERSWVQCTMSKMEIILLINFCSLPVSSMLEACSSDSQRVWVKARLRTVSIYGWTGKMNIITGDLWKDAGE